MTNIQVKELELKIAELINGSGINIATIALILDKLAKEANALLIQAIQEEQKQGEAETKTEEVEKVEAEIVE